MLLIRKNLFKTCCTLHVSSDYYYGNKICANDVFRGDVMRSEQELRDAVKSSRTEGYRVIFSQYSGYVYSIIWNHIRGVGTHEDAEETVSDVFADLFRNLDQIEDGKLESYIRTLSKRAAIDTFRRLIARPDAVSDDAAIPEDTASDENLEEAHELTELRGYLLDCILSLGEPDSSLLMLTYFYEKNAAEVGKALGMHPAAVRMRLTRARRRLRKLLEDADISL